MGNGPDNKTRNHDISPSLYARFVRLHAVEWHQLICMRVELIGCKGTLQTTHIRSMFTSDKQLQQTNTKGFSSIKCALI